VFQLLESKLSRVGFVADLERKHHRAVEENRSAMSFVWGIETFLKPWRVDHAGRLDACEILSAGAKHIPPQLGGRAFEHWIRGTAGSVTAQTR
jgi:hypothetical protein